MYCSQSAAKSLEACMEDFWRHRRTLRKIGTKMTESILRFLSRQISSCLFCSMLLLKFCRGISMNLWHYDYHYYVPYGYVRYMFVTWSIFSDLFFGEFPCAKVKGTEELAPITKEWSYLSIWLGMLGVEFSQSVEFGFKWTHWAQQSARRSETPTALARAACASAGTSGCNTDL